MSAWGILNRAFRMPSDGQKCPLTALELSLRVKVLTAAFYALKSAVF